MTTFAPQTLESGATSDSFSCTSVVQRGMIDGVEEHNKSNEGSAVPHSPREHEPENDGEPPSDEGNIPDGGLVAWTQVLTGHLVVFNVWGYLSSYGFFQEYYVNKLRLNPANASWIGAIQMFLVHLLGNISGRAMDAGWLRPCIALGCLFQIAGAYATSFGSEWWHFMLAQGIVSGVGHGLLFSPIISLYSTYFTSKRVMAVSLASCGAATGGMVFPVIAFQFFDRIGFAWTVRIMASIILVNCPIITKFTRARITSSGSPAWVDVRAFREASYSLFCVGSFLVFEGIYFAYIYVRQYAIQHTGFDAHETLLLLLLMNGVGLPARIAVAYLADRCLGAPKTCILVSVPTGVAILAWMAVRTHRGMFIWATIYGLLVNCTLSQLPALNAYFGAKDPQNSGTRVGMIMSINSIPLLTGPYIAGKLIDVGGGSFMYAQLFGGLCILTGALFLIAAKLAEP